MSRFRLLMATAALSRIACVPEGLGGGGGGLSAIPPDEIVWTDETPIAEVPETWRGRVAAGRLMAAEDGDPIPDDQVVWTDDTPLEDVPETWRERVAVERAAATFDDGADGEVGDNDAVPVEPAPESAASVIKKTVKAATAAIAASAAAAAGAAAEQAGKKSPRPRRGPPADGKPEKRVDMILTTSKLSDDKGRRLRRGCVVSVPERRIESLTRQDRVRVGSPEALDIAARRHGKFDLA